MSDWYPRAFRAIAVAGLSLSALSLSASPAAAEYRAWFAPWDVIGDFQPGDVSSDHTKMIPPPTACGLRIVDPGSYRWIDSYEVTGSSAELFKDVIIWIDNPGAGCSRSFSVEYYDGSATFLPPPTGGVSIGISTDYGSHWVNDNGYYLYTCGNCVGPSDEVAQPPQDIWALSIAASFKAMSASVVDPRRQYGVASLIGGVSRDVALAQPVVQKRISDRRRSPLGKLEVSVRGLEDAAGRALAAARTSAAACETLARQGAYAESFVACTTAGGSVEQTRSLMRTAWFLSHPPTSRGAASGR